MECKFKQIVNYKQQKNLFNSEVAVNNVMKVLLDKVSQHIFEKAAERSSNTFLKNKIISLEVDSVKQVYQNRPKIPINLAQQQSPMIEIRQNLRPMSAQVRYYQKKNIRNTISSQKRSIGSHRSFSSMIKTKNNLSSLTSLSEIGNNKGKYKKNNYSNVKKFFSIKSCYEEDDFEDKKLIQLLRMQKIQQENEAKKKEEFIKSIQLQNKNFSQTQAKFIQTMNRKKFIYGSQGQVIEINKNATSAHLKKISAASKSRVQIHYKTVNQINDQQEELKENIFIEFKGRQAFQSRPQTGKQTKFDKVNLVKNQNLVKKQLQLKKQQPINNKEIRTNNFLTVKDVKTQRMQKQVKNIQKNYESMKSHTQIKSEMQMTVLNEQKGEKNEQKGEKKKTQKIFFYQSPHAAYRIIDKNYAYNNDIHKNF